ncbi:MAG: DUF2752 domain-containing protein [Bacteroidetes bacterium]|nr:DUF2752 domain-containing protein [Bacteroidota bacterium]
MSTEQERKVTAKLLTGSAVELMIWAAAFIYLAAIDPYHPPASFCPSVLAGLGTCPGCGLGRSVSLLLHGEITASYHAHAAGIPAAVILFYRSGHLLKKVRHYSRRMNH